MKERLAILGAGESGVGAAVLGKAKGYSVFVSDKQQIQERYKHVLKHHKIDWEEENHSISKLLQAAVVVKSPGIPDTAPVVKELREAGIPIISEIEFAASHTEAILVGITGSNGKTTTATLTHFIMQQAGLNVGLAGNIGKSFAWQVATDQRDFYVLELSSFQLDGIRSFRPHIAVLTNITPDHLDRYNNNFEDYVASKFRLVENQTKDDYFIYDVDNEVIRSWVENHKIHAQKMPFSLHQKVERGAYVENKTLKILTANKQIEMPTKTVQLEGSHNLKNAMAASTVAKLLSIRKATIRESLTNFQGVEHRLEKVLKIHNVNYINDSKATNVNATFYALDSMTSPTVWIVGGVDKGNNYEELLPLVNEKVKAIICLGVDNQKIMDAFGNVISTLVEASSMEEAVQLAYRVAEKGDTVLLSPACASFDLFENYEDRGRQFKDAVRNL